MAIYFNRRGGGSGDGTRPYQGKRSAENPPLWAFFSIYAADRESPNAPQASVYKFANSTAVNGDDTIWDYDFFEIMTFADAVRWMRDHVSADESEW